MTTRRSTGWGGLDAGPESTLPSLVFIVSSGGVDVILESGSSYAQLQFRIIQQNCLFPKYAFRLQRETVSKHAVDQNYRERDDKDCDRKCDPEFILESEAVRILVLLFGATMVSKTTQ